MKSQHLIKLAEKRKSKEDRLAALLEKARSEAPDGQDYRDFTEEEQKEFDDLERDINNLDKEITNLERKIEVDKRLNKAHANKHTPEEKLRKNFSMSNFIIESADGRLSGRNKEIVEEARHEARGVGINLKGNSHLPSMFLDVVTPRKLKEMKQRDLDVGTSGKGQELIATELGELIPVLTIKPIFSELGATFLTGLSNNLSLPRKTAHGTALWKGEKAQFTETDPTLDTLDFSPHRLGAFEEYTRDLLVNNDYSVDQMVIEDLQLASEVKLNSTGIIGSGSDPEPFGVLNISGLTVIAIDTNGGPATYNAVLQVPEAIELNNASEGTLKWLTNPKVKRHLKTQTVDSGSGQFIWMKGEKDLDEYPAVISNHVPSNLEKAASGTILSALIFGDWSKWMILQWGGIDFVINPFTLDRESMVRVSIHTYWDMNARRDAHFAAIKDIDTTPA